MTTDFLNNFVDKINKLLFDDNIFYKEYIECLKSYDKDNLELCLKKHFEEKKANDGLINDILSTFQHHASSINYDSPTLGQWVRIRVLKNSIYDPCSPDSNISPFETDFHEQLHRTAPRQRNLLFSDDLKKPIQVQFGGKQNSKRKDIFYVSFTNWCALDTEISGKQHKKDNSFFIDDLKKFILAEPNENSKGYNFNTHCDTSIKKLMRDFKKYLENYLVNKDERNWHFKKIEDAFRLFIFTYFYTVKLKSSDNPIYHLIIPLREAGNPIGSYCGAFKNEIELSDIESLQKCFGILIRNLYTIECIAHQKLETRQFLSAEGENIIRLCAFVPEDAEIPLEMKRLYNQMKHFGSNRKNKSSTNNFDLITKKLVSADPIYLSMIEELCFCARDYGSKEGKCVMLYGEPGLGKGPLAKLLHYSSCRSNSNTSSKDFMGKPDKFPAKYYLNYELKIGEYKEKLKKHKTNLKKYQLAFDKNSSKENEKKYRDEKRKIIEFNFMEDHASQLKRDNLEWFLGSEKKPGRLSILTLLQGTLFLDELHTIDLDVLLELHRIWGEPYEIKPINGIYPIGINVFTIFASNESPQQLKEKKFNAALLSRISQFARRIPPLRERKQDIALLVNHFIRTRHNKDARKNSKIRFIDPAGLRVLTELSWKGTNVRGVIQFIDDLLQDRKIRKIESREISFDEIMNCVRRRELI